MQWLLWIRCGKPWQLTMPPAPLPLGFLLAGPCAPPKDTNQLDLWSAPVWSCFLVSNVKISDCAKANLPASLARRSALWQFNTTKEMQSTTISACFQFFYNTNRRHAHICRILQNMGGLMWNGTSNTSTAFMFIYSTYAVNRHKLRQTRHWKQWCGCAAATKCSNVSLPRKPLQHLWPTPSFILISILGWQLVHLVHLIKNLWKGLIQDLLSNWILRK